MKALRANTRFLFRILFFTISLVIILAWAILDRGPDLLPTEDYEKVEVIPLFFYAGSDSYQELPSVIGASNCRRAAMTFAALKNVEDTDWTYICATTDGKYKIR